MSLNRTAKGIVLVPSLLLGGAFLAAAVWGDGAAADNKTLALGLGAALMGAGLLAQLLPESPPERECTPTGTEAPTTQEARETP